MRILITALAFLFCQELSGQYPRLVILGVAQDAGYPQAGCKKECCAAVWQDRSAGKMVSSLAVIDSGQSGIRCWMIDATPDFRDQLNELSKWTSGLDPVKTLKRGGILLTHGHIGHYTGIMHLGREAIGADSVPVYVMPRMSHYLRSSGPWSQLVQLGNVELRKLASETPVQLSENVRVTPFLVPHRDEFTETVGFRIEGPDRTAVYIPDIDKWHLWNRSLPGLIRDCDIAFLDGTFFGDGEVPRDMSEIPHPFVVETMKELDSLPAEERSKVHFIHFNHTNPLLQPESAEVRQLMEAHFRMALQGSVHDL